MNRSLLIIWVILEILSGKFSAPGCAPDYTSQSWNVKSTRVKSVGGVKKDSTKYSNHDPVPGDSGKIVVSYYPYGGVKLQWTTGTDKEDAFNTLRYKLFYHKDMDSVTGVGNIETFAVGCTPVMTNVNYQFFDTIARASKLYFNILIYDYDENAVAYKPVFVDLPEEKAPVPGNSGHITTTDQTIHSINLAWNAATDYYHPPADLEYLVYYSLSNNIATVADCQTNGTPFGTWTKNITTLAITGLSQGTLYYFNIVVKNPRSFKSCYQVTQNTTDFEDPPVAGGSGEITAIFVGTRNIVLSWPYGEDDVSTQANLQYLIYHSSSGNIATLADCEANGTPSGSWAVNINSGVVTGLNASTQYYFNVIVKDEVGNKGIYKMADTSTITTDDPPLAGNGGDILVKSSAYNTARVTWTKATDAESLQNTLMYCIYYSLSDNITTLSDCETNGTPSGPFISDTNAHLVTGLTSFTKYYFNVIVKDQDDNKAVYQPDTAKTWPGIGDYYQGGIVFYVLDTTGLICSLNDLNTAATWGCYGTALPNCSYSYMGGGKLNTNSIVSNCPTAGIAARLCSDYDDGTYSDWYLPSRLEATTLLSNLAAVNAGLLANGGTIVNTTGVNDYWSSTQMPASPGAIVIPPTGSDDKIKAYTMKGNADKNTTKGVRAVRFY